MKPAGKLFRARFRGKLQTVWYLVDKSGYPWHGPYLIKLVRNFPKFAGSIKW